MAQVVFSVRNFWYLKFYESVFRELARRGHDVHVMADRGLRGQDKQWTSAMMALAAEEPRITFSWTPQRIGDTYFDLGYWLRRSLDYLRFFDRTFDAAPVLRRRAAVRAPRIIRALVAPAGRSMAGVAGLLARVASVTERAVTTGAHLDEWFASRRPDAVVVAPLVTLGSTQYDVLRATRRAGIPTAVSVGSWDHLSSKTLIRPKPDWLIVWNSIQTEEAVRFHALSRDQVRVTGAQGFDEWFGRAPDRDRETFCRELGLPADAPIVLYVCSALFEGSPSEAEFVMRWVAGLRQSTHDVLRRASVLIRPHPKRAREWTAFQDAHDPATIVWPRQGEAPLDAKAKGSYFDSLHHSTAIVGLNTSALIEGGILSRPVYTVLLPEFRDNQEGTLHFRHLLDVGGGLLHAGRSLDEHYDQLAAGLRDPRAASARNAAFVQAFVRPQGLDRSATDVFAETVEELIAMRGSVRALPDPAWVAVVRGAVYPFARALQGTAPGSPRLWRMARRERERLAYQQAQEERLRRKRAAQDLAQGTKRGAGVKVLFSVNSFGFLRNFEHALRVLAARGHSLHLLAERADAVGGMRTIDGLRRDFPSQVTWAFAPSRKQDLWQPLALQVRLCLDYWRYLEPHYERAFSLRERAARQAPRLASALPRVPVVGSRPAMRVWRALFRAIERALPPGGTVEQILEEQNPDLVLLTPLLYFGSQQVEYVRAARALGIRTLLGVGSWDHLTTKGLIHEQPDRVVVWNEMQRREAVELHGIPADRVAVTGAQAYDHWFTQQPSTTREAFCDRVGVPSDRPLLLYLCSSPFITPCEVGFVRRWIAAIRASAHPELSRAAILIRPHPQNAEQWHDFDPSFDSALGIWPRAGANPVDADARADYFDSMFHSAAVVGVNTSALIESGIVGRQVFTVLADEFAGQQDATLHFQHLKNVNGGLLRVASTLEEHCTQLGEALAGDRDVSTGRAFIEAFIRPHGLDVAAADRFADVVEVEARLGRLSPVSPGLSIRARQWLLYPAALIARRLAPRKKAAVRDDKDARTPAPSQLRILFALASPEYLRYFDSTMKLLVSKGHTVSVGVNWMRERKSARLDDLIDDPAIKIVGTIPKRADTWTPMARAVRGTMDFVRYLHPRFASAPVLRARLYRKALPPLLRPLDRIRSLSERSLGRVIGWLQAIERAIPVSDRLTRFLEGNRPDVVIVSPLVDVASDQVDMVRAARALGIPTVAAISSWDNLTSKGLLRVEPDLVTVWNDVQKDEAITLHGVAPERVAVTGAQLFDRWFDRSPSLDRAAFCRQVGLPGDEPFVLFTGSSVFIARSEIEVPFVRRWLTALRESGDERLRDIPVLVRPHPFNGEAWSDADFSDLGPVAIWPRQRYTPAAESARTSFFDSLYHSAAVVGINTSAMIEAAILLKPVFSVLAPEFANTQDGTLHFHYLRPENGGFLRIADSIESHIAQLRAVLDAPETVRAQTQQFVGAFLRPRGLDVPCTPILAASIEQRGLAGEVAPERERMGTRVLRVCLWPAAVVVKWFHLGEDLPALVRRKLYEVWQRRSRGTRLVLKHVVVRPARLAIWTAGVTRKKTKSLARRARYHVAVRVRAAALAFKGDDGPG